MRATRWVGTAFALAVAATTAQAQYTWTQWTAASGGNDHWYTLTTAPRTFGDYVAEATAAGGYAASVLSAAENAFLFATYTTGVVNTPSLFIGYVRSGTDYANPCASSGAFVWVSGEPVGYTNWNPGEPNYSSCDNVALFNNNAPAGWNDVPTVSGAFGTIMAVGIIESSVLPGAVVPEPATVLLAASGLVPLAVAARRRRRRAGGAR